MDYNVLAVLRAACEMVLGEMAFMFCEPLDESIMKKVPGMEWCQGSMAFSGPLRGKIHAAAGGDFCRALAGNMLGLEPDEPASEKHAADALKELLNVICGRFLSDAFGIETVFNLNAPVISVRDAFHMQNTIHSDGTLLFNVENEVLAVSLSFDNCSEECG